MIAAGRILQERRILSLVLESSQNQETAGHQQKLPGGTEECGMELLQESLKVGELPWQQGAVDDAEKLLPGFSEKIPAVQHCPKSRVRTQAFRPWLPTPDLNHTALSGILFFPPGSPKCDSTHSPQLLLLKRLPPLWRLS